MQIIKLLFNIHVIMKKRKKQEEADCKDATIK